jgi:hypothetical protein
LHYRRSGNLLDQFVLEKVMSSLTPLSSLLRFCLLLVLSATTLALSAATNPVEGAPAVNVNGEFTIYLPLIFRTGTSSVVERVVITPGAALLTATGESRLLTAQAVDAGGNPVPAIITWSSSDAAAVSVAGSGMITAHTGAGSAQIRAQAGNRSATAMVVVAQTVPGAVLVSDSQIATPPQPVDPNALFGVGYQYTVTLQNVSAPAIGAILLGSETMPVAGRVLAVAPIGPQTVVTLAMVKLNEAFAELSINETVELSTLTVLPEVTAAFTVTHELDGSLTFALKPSKARALAAPTTGFEVGPFDCEVEGSAVQLELLAAEFNFQDRLTYSTVWNSSQQKIVIQGQPQLSVSLKPSLRAQLQGRLECKVKLTERIIPVPGPVGIFLGAVVEVGGGFSIEGATPIATGVSIEIKDEASGTFEAGFDCLNDVCQAVKSVELVHSNSADVKDNVSLTPEVDRLELSATAFLYADLKAGITLFRRFGAGGFGVRNMELDVLGATVGPKLAGEFASEETQAADPNYASTYELSLEGSIGAGKRIDDFIALVDISVVELELTTTLALAHSPTASVTASQTQAQAGDVVTFTLSFITNTVTFPFIGYNIEAVRVYKKTPGGGLLVAAEVLSASAGQHRFELPVVVTEPLTVTTRYVAFVQTKVMPFLRLELGPVTAGLQLQFGTETSDRGRSVAVDNDGNVVVVGYTQGSLDGPNAGGLDAFVRKYSPNGSALWTRQLGTANLDDLTGVTVDAGGNVFVTGMIGTNAGPYDAFVRKYSPTGDNEWTRQFGTGAGELAYGVAVDADGNVVVVGNTLGSLGGPLAGPPDVFVRKYSPSGNALWTRQFGTEENDTGLGVAVDADGNVLVTGYTYGSLGGPNAGSVDVFVRKYSPNGSVIWTRQFGTQTADQASSVAVDANKNILVAGLSLDPNAGQALAFVRKYNPSGDVLWTQQFGTDIQHWIYGMAADVGGNVLLAGHVFGSLAGPNAGGYDAFVRKLDPTGNVIWTRQFGTEASETAYGAAVDTGGNVVITGETSGSLFGPNAGRTDVFLRRFTADGE